jgi:hypothetical protein
MPVQIWLQKIYIFSHFFRYIQGGNFTRERALFFFRKDLVCYQGLQCTHSLLYLDMSWRKWLVCFTSAEAVKFPSCEFQQLSAQMLPLIVSWYFMCFSSCIQFSYTTIAEVFRPLEISHLVGQKKKDKTRKKLMTTCIKYLNEML